MATTGFCCFRLMPLLLLLVNRKGFAFFNQGRAQSSLRRSAIRLDLLNDTMSTSNSYQEKPFSKDGEWVKGRPTVTLLPSSCPTVQDFGQGVQDAMTSGGNDEMVVELGAGYLQGYIDSRGLKAQVVPGHAFPQLEDEKYNLLRVRTLLFQIIAPESAGKKKSRTDMVVALVPDQARVDRGLLANYLGVRRERLALLGQGRARRALGYPRGPVPPFGWSAPHRRCPREEGGGGAGGAPPRAVVDTRVVCGPQYVVGGGGDKNHYCITCIQSLMIATGAEVADICGNPDAMYIKSGMTTLAHDDKDAGEVMTTERKPDSSEIRERAAALEALVAGLRQGAPGPGPGGGYRVQARPLPLAAADLARLRRRRRGAGKEEGYRRRGRGGGGGGEGGRAAAAAAAAGAPIHLVASVAAVLKLGEFSIIAEVIPLAEHTITRETAAEPSGTTGQDDVRLVRQVFTDDRGTPLQVDVQFGKSLLRNVGKKKAKTVLSQIKVGCTVYVAGTARLAAAAAGGADLRGGGGSAATVLVVEAHAAQLRPRPLPPPCPATAGGKQRLLQPGGGGNDGTAAATLVTSHSQRGAGGNTEPEKFLDFGYHGFGYIDSDVTVVDDLQSLKKMRRFFNALLSSLNATVSVYEEPPPRPIVGLDAEWRPHRGPRPPAAPHAPPPPHPDPEEQEEEGDEGEPSKGGAGWARRRRRRRRRAQHPAATLQLAARGRGGVFVLDLLRWFRPGLDYTQPLNEKEEQVADILGSLFRDPGVLKIGFDVHSDLKKLAVSYPHVPCFQLVRGTLDLNRLTTAAVAAQFPDAKHHPVEYASLSKLSRLFLGRPLDKSEQCSDWGARPLSPSQVRYAALDAAATAALHDRLAPHAPPSLAAAGAAAVYRFDPAAAAAVAAGGVTLPPAYRAKARRAWALSRRASTKTVPLKLGALRGLWLGATLPATGKEAVVELAVNGTLAYQSPTSWQQYKIRRIKDGSAAGSLQFNRHQNFVEFANGAALFLNVYPLGGGPRDDPLGGRPFADGGRACMWRLPGYYAGGGKLGKIIAKIRSTRPKGGPVSDLKKNREFNLVLFCRLPGQPYTCCGRVSYLTEQKVSIEKNPYIEFILRLDDQKSLELNSPLFKSIVAIGGLPGLSLTLPSCNSNGAPATEYLEEKECRSSVLRKCTNKKEAEIIFVAPDLSCSSNNKQPIIPEYRSSSSKKRSGDDNRGDDIVCYYDDGVVSPPHEQKLINSHQTICATTSSTQSQYSSAGGNNTSSSH